MKHAREDYNRIQDPAGLIPADEPVFLLRAQDELACRAVAYYAGMCADVQAPEISARALAHSKAMAEWPKKKVPDLPEGLAAHTEPVAHAGFAPVTWTPADEQRLDAAIAARNARRVAQAPAQAGEVATFEDWWYGHDGVRQRQVAYLGWPCTKELAESIWNGAREQAPSSLAVALQQAREALAYHQAQTRPIDKTVDAIKAIDAALATPPAHPVLAPVVREPLSDERIDQLFLEAHAEGYGMGWQECGRRFARAVIQATTGEQSHD